MQFTNGRTGTVHDDVERTCADVARGGEKNMPVNPIELSKTGLVDETFSLLHAAAVSQKKKRKKERKVKRAYLN